MEFYTSDREAHKRYSKGRILTILFVFFFLLLIGYFLYNKLLIKKEPAKEDNGQKIEGNEPEPEEEIRELILKSEFQTVDGQSVYIAYDENAKEDAKFPLVIYSHGSTYSVSEKTGNPLTKDLDFYADMFVKNGYIFAASNQHGDNWGNSTAIEDTRKLAEYLNTNYKSNGEIYLLGFSMGGLVTMNFAEKYPKDIKKIALLAPTSYTNTWNAGRVAKIMEIPIKIWHGNRDVNVPYSMSTNFINKLKSFGKEVEFITIEGVGHFDIDTEYTEAIVEFYKAQ